MCCVEMHRIIRPLLCDIRIVGHKKVRNPAKYAAGFFFINEARDFTILENAKRAIMEKNLKSEEML